MWETVEALDVTGNPTGGSQSLALTPLVRGDRYDRMVRIVVLPTWAKLIDFETTLPSAVEELVRQRDERQRA